MTKSDRRQSTHGWSDLAAIGIIIVVVGAFGAAGGLVVQHMYATKHRPFDRVTLIDDVLYVTGRKWPIVENTPKGPYLRWLEQTKDGIQLTRELNLDGPRTTDTVTILVHGFHSSEQDVSGYFSGLIAHLKQDKAKSAGQFVIYDWPSLAVRYNAKEVANLRVLEDPQNPARGRWFGLIVPRFEEGLWENSQYVLDKQMAETEGVPGLPILTQTIRDKLRPRKLNIIAHSMGAWLVLQALEKYPADMLPIDRLILLAPDVPANVLSDDGLRTVAARIGSVHVYHSRLDDILALTEIGWKEKSMGRVGPNQVEALPSTVKVHDVTEAFGADKVHGKYLKQNGAKEIALGEALR